MGTKYDYFSTFSKEEQEEVTKQASLFFFSVVPPLRARFCFTAGFSFFPTNMATRGMMFSPPFVSLWEPSRIHTGAQIRKSNEGAPDLLLDLTFNQRSEDL